MIGNIVVDIFYKYKVNKLLKQLDKVSDTGDEMWGNGVKYAVEQIKKIL